MVLPPFSMPWASLLPVAKPIFPATTRSQGPSALRNRPVQSFYHVPRSWLRRIASSPARVPFLCKIIPWTEHIPRLHRVLVHASILPAGVGSMSKTGAILNDIYDAYRAQNLDWLATYLPDDFCHVMHFPTVLHPLAGACQGKQAVLDRWRLYLAPLEILRFDTSGLMIENDRAAVEIPLHYRHKATGAELTTTKANIWTLEEGWPVKLAEYYDLTPLQVFAQTINARTQDAQ